MIPLHDNNIDQIIEEFSSDELVNLSEDLLQIAIELSLQDNLDLLSMDSSIARGNDLLVIIPKILASRFDKAEVYSRKFTSLNTEELLLSGYSLEELRNIRKLLEDVISLIEKRSSAELHTIYQEVFEELKDSFEINVDLYRDALHNVNEAYRILSRHLMMRAIEVYKHVTFYNFEHFLHEKIEVLEEYQKHLDNAIELLESSEMVERYPEQLHGLRKTQILVLEAINAQTVGTGFSQKRFSYIHDILYHIRDNPEEYIFQVLRRFASFSSENTLRNYMPPEEIAVRHKTKYIKHNRVLMSFLSNSINVSQDTILEITNNILKNLSSALNVKLQFVRASLLCDQIIATSAEHQKCLYTKRQLNSFYKQLEDALHIMEIYLVNSDYLEALQEKCYRTAVMVLEWFETEPLFELANLFQRYQLYISHRLFVLRISILCMFISSHSAQELSQLASERILTVCRELVQYKYDSLKPSSVYLETMFDLEHYRDPVLAKLDVALQYVQGVPTVPPETAEMSEEEAVLSQFSKEHLGAKHLMLPSLSQLIIDCLALKVQELDKPLSPLLPGEDSYNNDLHYQMESSRERIEYFLKQYQEEKQHFMSSYKEDDDLSEADTHQ